MPLDKALYRQAYEAYRQMNEAEERYRVQNAGQLVPQEAWRQFVDLWEFGWQMGLTPSDRQREQKITDLAHYYRQVQRLEIWRRARGRAS